ncbi:hypothetical protein [Serratia marcescens]|uniref:hypothetical protein n=1 Tax=Serratia marcescens TaxID=615 RepID=UPI0012FE5495|nr:hypothetical protein [Serratia marcescens]
MNGNEQTKREAFAVGIVVAALAGQSACGVDWDVFLLHSFVVGVVDVYLFSVAIGVLAGESYGGNEWQWHPQYRWHYALVLSKPLF